MTARRGGFTLIEAMLTAAIALLVIFAFLRFLPQIPLFFQRIRVRQQIQTDSRVAMDRMTQLLRNGVASSVEICSCNNARCSGACTANASIPPNSQLNFKTQDGRWHRFFWNTDTLFVEDYNNDSVGNTLLAKATLANHVGSIAFSGDYRDFAIMNIDLRIDAPLDTTGNPHKILTTILPTQSIRMITTQ